MLAAIIYRNKWENAILWSFLDGLNGEKDDNILLNVVNFEYYTIKKRIHFCGIKSFREYF